MAPSIDEYWSCPKCELEVCHACGECPTCQGDCLCPAPRGRLRSVLDSVACTFLIAAVALLAKLGFIDLSWLTPGLMSRPNAQG